MITRMRLRSKSSSSTIRSTSLISPWSVKIRCSAVSLRSFERMPRIRHHRRGCFKVKCSMMHQGMSPIKTSRCSVSQAIPSIRLMTEFRLSLNLMSYCQPTYFGNQCSIRCIPNDDCTSSYTCNAATGAKICAAGWFGTDCTLRNTSSVQPLCTLTGKAFPYQLWSWSTIIVFRINV